MEAVSIMHPVLSRVMLSDALSHHPRITRLARNRQFLCSLLLSPCVCRRWSSMALTLVATGDSRYPSISGTAPLHHHVHAYMMTLILYHITEDIILALAMRVRDALMMMSLLSIPLSLPSRLIILDDSGFPRGMRITDMSMASG